MRSDGTAFREFLDGAFDAARLHELTKAGVSMRLNMIWRCVNRESKMKLSNVYHAMHRCIREDNIFGQATHCMESGALCLQRMDWRTKLFVRFFHEKIGPRAGDIRTRLASREHIFLGKGTVGDTKRYRSIMGLFADLYEEPEAAQVIVPEPGINISVLETNRIESN